MFKSYFRTNMMFHNDSLATLSAGNYAYWRIWDRNDICVVFPKKNIWTLPGFSDIVEGTLKFLTEINNRFGFKPNAYIVTVAEVRTFTSKAVRGQRALQLER